jgi:hypothetical protein
MIFALWSLFWIATSGTCYLLLVPLFSVIIRNNYLDRPIKSIFKFVPLLFSMIIFLFMIANNMETMKSINVAGKVFVSSLLLMHLASGIRYINISFLSINAQTLFYIIKSSISLHCCPKQF